jgi:hypothetical protein
MFSNCTDNGLVAKVTHVKQFRPIYIGYVRTQFQSSTRIWTGKLKLSAKTSFECEIMLQT